jgi:hypothetical protein
VSQQRLNPFTAGAQVRAGLDQVETRQLQAPEYRGVERRNRHDVMVASAEASMEVQSDTPDPSNQVQTLDLEAVIEKARMAVGLTHGQLCAYMADDDGKPLDQSLWTRMRRDGNLPVKRMRKLPLAFWRHFVIGLAEPAGVQVTHADIETLAVRDLLLACVAAPVVSERRRA